MLELKDVNHCYGQTLTVKNVSLNLGAGEVACLLGPSGCGKTTLLRCVAGFEHVRSGTILIDDSVVSSTALHVAAEKRRIGMVFQDYALLPHLSVQENVMFGLHEKNRGDAVKISGRFLEQVGLDELASRFPHELSGGQQQRVAIARALAPGPELLLMDEPFSNLDASMRSGIGREIKSLLASVGATALIATHDHHDAFALGDTLGVMNKGELLQWDSTYNIYHQPEEKFVAEFIGRGVWMAGRVKSENEVETEIGTAHGVMTSHFSSGTEVELFLRPDDVVHDDASSLQIEVAARQFRGSDFLYQLRLPSGMLILSSVPGHHDHPVGDKIGIRLETDHLVVFPRR